MGSNNPGNSRSNQIVGRVSFPLREGQGSVVVPVQIQPRQPRNLQGLLRFAMEATKAEDAPGNSDFNPMDEERRRFLEEALRSLTVDMAHVLEASFRTLTDMERMKSIQFGDPLPEDVEAAFNTLLEFIDDIDVANDFYKIGGFAIFPICYGSENELVRAHASGVLAELCQNNPFCQAKALECGLLGILLNLLPTERGVALAKCLYAISCCTREFSPSCEQLCASGGCGLLGAQLAAPERAARAKAAFLVRYLAQHYPDAREQFIEQNIVKIIAGQIRQGRDDTSEHLLNILSSLLEGLDPTVVAQCRDPDIDLKILLENHLQHPDLLTDRFIEEKEYCQDILSKVFDNFTPVVETCEEADR